MSEKYAPGTVATATVRGVPNVRVVRVEYPTTPPWMTLSEHPTGAVWHPEAEVTDVRPLVVLDLNDGGDFWTDGYSTVRSLLRNLRNPGGHVRFTDLADAIEQQTRPPKPEEVGTMDEFHADGRQYLVPTRASGKFLEAGSAIKRLQVAELVVEDGRVIKNRRGATS